MTTWKIEIAVKANRSLPGVLRLLRSDGALAFQCSCLGLADSANAKAHGNPQRDPLKPFGDTPLGKYDGTLLPYVLQPPHSYGTEPPIALEPTDGPAKEAQEIGRRSGFLIHSGALAKGEFLRPTYGCIRVRPDAHTQLVRLLRAAKVTTLPVEIKEIAA